MPADRVVSVSGTERCEACGCGYRMVPRSPQGEAHEAGIEAAKQTDAARAIPDGEQGPWPGTKAFDAEVAAGVREIVAAYLSRCPSPVSGTEPDTAKLVAEYVRKNFGLVTADCTADTIADFILAGFSVDASPEPDTALRRHVIEALTAAIDNASTREHFVRRIELLLDELGAAGFSVDAGNPKP